MLKHWPDFLSRIAYSAINGVLTDAPKRTAYGFVLGLFFHVMQTVVYKAFSLDAGITTWECIVLGIFVIHAKTIFRHVIGKPGISEQYIEKLELIRRAQEAGLSDQHAQVQIYALVRQALNEKTAGDNANPTLGPHGESASVGADMAPPINA